MSFTVRAVAGLFLGVSCTALGESPLPQVERLQSSPVLRHLQPNPTNAQPKNGPEETVAQMYVPKGFRVDLVVAEPDLHQPIAFTFDERGRIWVAEAYSYPQRQPEGEGRDKIVIFEDGDADGKFETRKVFAEGLNLVSGFEVGHGGVWVGAAPEFLFIPDRNRDDKPDGAPEVLLDGFGYQDTHECLNSFMWGPDGWLYGNQGVFNFAKIGKPGTRDDQRVELRAGVWRYHPIRRQFEVFAHGGSNQWGLDYDERGQIFMTHCRSYWGRGGTTHVIQGGQFWNQANANYAPFIIANPPRDFPEFRNYLLASARYDHGAGGAGAPGSDAIYGGHSHVGTMIYLGDNWPDEYRGRVFTHNLHGHQINQQVNRRWGSGFDTVHAGQDMFFCTDPKYVGVDLQYGPDGAVYTIDWYDQQHCHNPNTERWDRSNGRIYRMQYEATFKPARVDMAAMSTRELVGKLKSKNQWRVRTARRLIHERGAELKGLQSMIAEEKDPAHRLSLIWTAHGSSGLNERLAATLLNDPDEYVRAWTVQLISEEPSRFDSLFNRLAKMAQTDPSPVVRMYLASALPRWGERAWTIAEALARHGEDQEDRNIPYLLWHGIAPLMERNPQRALALADATLLPQLADWIYWYATTLEGHGLNAVIDRLKSRSGEAERRLLAGIALGLKTRASVPMPEEWREVAPKLYASPDARIVREAESIGAVLGDDSIFPRLRDQLANPNESPEQRKHAFAVLSRAQDSKALPVFIDLVDEKPFRLEAIKLLGRFDSPQVPSVLLRSFESFNIEEKNAALNVLTGRASYAQALLDAIAENKFQRDQLTAFHVRQMTELKNAQVNERVTQSWGRFGTTAAEKESQIANMEKVYNEAPLWAYEGSAGRMHFQKLCASCHKIGNEGNRFGPELTGAGRNGIRYYLENVIDPDAVIGSDFQLTNIEMKNGDSHSGVIVNETPEVVTLRTVIEQLDLPKDGIASRQTSEKSIMPEGLLDALGSREQIELLKFLMGN